MADVVPDGDVLLNFAPIDDQPMFDGRPGWVSQLYRHLSVRMEQLSGERIKLARHPGFTGKHETDLELQQHLAKVKAMAAFEPKYVAPTAKQTCTPVTTSITAPTRQM